MHGSSVLAVYNASNERPLELVSSHHTTCISASCTGNVGLTDQ